MTAWRILCRTCLMEIVAASALPHHVRLVRAQLSGVAACGARSHSVQVTWNLPDGTLCLGVR
jgi:hypothetical protein